MLDSKPTVVEICAGAGGQSLGLEQAGFHHVAAIDVDVDSCITLKRNRPHWDVIEADVREIDGHAYKEVDLLAGGVPCPPFSIAGKQLGALDERDLFPEALRLAEEIKPRAVMLENVRGFATPRFAGYRDGLKQKFELLGYKSCWRVLNAYEFGVPQYRPRFVLVGLREDDAPHFKWPCESGDLLTVGETLVDLMGANNWPGAGLWANKANGMAPTIVGGSKKHGGPDLGPTRARREWLRLGVDGKGIAIAAPGTDFPVEALPRLTVRMVARLQGFPDDWSFSGTKTSSYKQVGNAFPPPAARAVACSILNAIARRSQEKSRQLSLLI